MCLRCRALSWSVCVSVSECVCVHWLELYVAPLSLSLPPFPPSVSACVRVCVCAYVCACAHAVCVLAFVLDCVCACKACRTSFEASAPFSRPHANYTMPCAGHGRPAGQIAVQRPYLQQDLLSPPAPPSLLPTTHADLQLLEVHPHTPAALHPLSTSQSHTGRCVRLLPVLLRQGSVGRRRV